MVRLIVGLGNVGKAYEDTRHNAGFWFVEALARHYQIALAEDKKFFGRVGKGKIEGEEVWLLLPSTLMNLSGKSVASLSKFYNIDSQQMLVAHDELDLPVGTIRLKTGGGHGGHNGLRDIMAVGSSDFHRLRIGIGRPSNGNVSGFVLAKPSLDERLIIDRTLDCALQAVPMLMAGMLDKARNHINGFKV